MYGTRCTFKTTVPAKIIIASIISTFSIGIIVLKFQKRRDSNYEADNEVNQIELQTRAEMWYLKIVCDKVI